MKKPFVLLVAFCGVMAVLLAPGIVAAFDSGYGNDVIIPNTNGGEGPGWGAEPNGRPIPIDGHGDSNVVPVFSFVTPQQVNTGIVMTWLGNASTLPPGVSFDTPFNGASVLGSLSAFLSPSGPYGNQINDLIMINMGISAIYAVSEPAINLYPFATGSAPSPPYECPAKQEMLWGAINSALWPYSVVIIPEQTITLSGLPGTYTPYTPLNDTYPGWDYTLAFRGAGACQGGYCQVLPYSTYTPPFPYTGPPVPVDYINPADWTQWTYEIQNDTPTVPEPGALLLLGFGLMALAGMRRLVKAKA
ncbi:MAG: PEP-CTERM sorting domain-containing protein [Syntrophorhabdales bacterium]|jgi:hypothetical protein